MSTKIVAPNKAEKNLRRWAYITIFTPLVVSLLALTSLSLTQPSVLVLSVAALMYVLTALGITAGYHRHYTHQSYKANAFLAKALHILGAMAGQGPLLFWVAAHRQHHHHSDKAEDPHTPNKGFLYAHVGWMLKHSEFDYRYSKDLMKRRDVVNTDMNYHYYLLAGLFLPGLLCGAITQSFMVAIEGVVWAGFVRMGLLHHSTWAVNSICHIWGRQPFNSKDRSRNNYIVALLTMGEGFHNAHHTFPRSAKHGILWWEFDFTYCCIKFWKQLGWAWDIHVPSPEKIQLRRNTNTRLSTKEYSDEQ